MGDYSMYDPAQEVAKLNAAETQVRALREENARLRAEVARLEVQLREANENVSLLQSKLDREHRDHRLYETELLGRVERLTRERDEARAEAKRYHDALVARHGGEPVALLEELDASRAEVARLENLILDWDSMDMDGAGEEAVALEVEARRIRAAKGE